MPNKEPMSDHADTRLLKFYRTKRQEVLQSMVRYVPF
jgi:hypothetical protein